MLEQKSKQGKPWYKRFDKVNIAIGTIVGILMLVLAVLTYFKPDAQPEQVENNTVGRDQIKADQIIINNNYGDTLKPNHRIRKNLSKFHGKLTQRPNQINKLL